MPKKMTLAKLDRLATWVLKKSVRPKNGMWVIPLRPPNLSIATFEFPKITIPVTKSGKWIYPEVQNLPGIRDQVWAWSLGYAPNPQ